MKQAELLLVNLNLKGGMSDIGSLIEKEKQIKVLGLNARTMFAQKNQCALEITLKKQEIDVAFINETMWEKGYEAKF